VKFRGMLPALRSRSMFNLSRGPCRGCGTPISHFALRCANCRAPNQPNAVATTAALLLTCSLGAAAALGAALFRHNLAQHRPADAPAAASEPGPAGTQDYSWIMEAMAKCEAESKQQPDMLHFIVVPMSQTGSSLPGWSPTPIADVGSSGKLLSATHALFGLRNGVLMLYAKPLTFLISDPNTKTAYKWQPAVGVAELATKELASGNLTLGFEMPDVADEIQWGPAVGITKGSCYWINLLVLARRRDM
jgi:hypothetical protein